jgi:hypothetical protein
VRIFHSGFHSFLRVYLPFSAPQTEVFIPGKENHYLILGSELPLNAHISKYS